MSASNPAGVGVESNSRRLARGRVSFQRPVIRPGLALGFCIILGVIIGPEIWNHSPIDQSASLRLQNPSLNHPLGTDRYGRDLFARVLIGGRWTLAGGFFVTLGVSGIAMTIGAITAIGFRWLDQTLGRVIDAMLAIPNLVIALALTSLLGPSFRNVIVALIITGWPWYARAYRMVFLQAWSASFVEGSIACGATRPRTLIRHVLPSAAGPIAVLVTINLGFSILNLTSLSFLGLGIQPPTPEWGALINDARPYFQKAPLQMVAPGLAIVLSVLAINVAGDEIRDHFDPRISNRYRPKSRR